MMRIDCQSMCRRTMSMKTQQVYRELDKASKKTCFCTHEHFAKAFGGWREEESILSEENECGATASGDHAKYTLFLCEVARQEKHSTAPKAAKKHDVSSTVYRRGVKRREGDGKSYFCHLESSIEKYRKSKGKLCTAILDDYMKVVEGEPHEEGTNKMQVIVDPIDQNEGAHSQHHQISTIVYKGTTPGVYYTEPVYPPLYAGSSTTVTTKSALREEPSSSGHSTKLQAVQGIVASDDWVPGNAVYQERNNCVQLQNSTSYYQYHGSISPAVRQNRCNSPITAIQAEKIVVKHLKKRDGKRCAVIEYKKTDLDGEQLAIIATKEGAGQLRSAKMKSSSVETDQKKLQDLVVTQSYTSTSKLDTTSQIKRQNSGRLRTKKSRACLVEKRETISSIPSKGSLSRLPQLHVSSRGLTATPDSGTGTQEGSGEYLVNQSAENATKLKSYNVSSLLDQHRPPLPLASKQQISDRLQKVSKKLTHGHNNPLPKPFKQLTKVKRSPFHDKHSEKTQSSEKRSVDKIPSTDKRTKKGHFEEARCVLRSRERRKGRLHRKIGHGYYQERTSYRVKVCLKGSKMPLFNPSTKSTEDNEDSNNNFYNVEELYAE